MCLYFWVGFTRQNAYRLSLLDSKVSLPGMIHLTLEQMFQANQKNHELEVCLSLHWPEMEAKASDQM